MSIREFFKGNGGGESPEMDDMMTKLEIELEKGEAAYQITIPIAMSEEIDDAEVGEAGEDDILTDAPFYVRGREFEIFVRVLAYNKIPFSVEPLN